MTALAFVALFKVPAKKLTPVKVANHNQMIGLILKNDAGLWRVESEMKTGDVWRGQVIQNYWRNKFWAIKNGERMAICVRWINELHGFDLGESFFREQK